MHITNQTISQTKTYMNKDHDTVDVIIYHNKDRQKLIIKVSLFPLWIFWKIYMTENPTEKVHV